MKRLFISFSSSNRYTRDVVARLSAQPDLLTWDFRSAPIPLGADIAVAVCERVRQSNALLLLLTSEALSSKHIQREVAAALASKVPVLCLADQVVASSDDGWPRELLDFSRERWCLVDFARLESIENGIREVCRTLGLEYRPRTEPDPDFPIAPRLYEELRELAPLSAEYENRVYLTLWQLAEAAHALYARRDYRAAAQTLDGLIAYYQREFPKAVAYYPVIARALCALHLERWPEATALLEELSKSVEAPGAPRTADPALHGSLGVVSYQLGRLEEARQRFERGLALGSKDPAPRCYLVLCRIQLGEVLDIEAEFAPIRAMASAVDRRAVDVSQARACAMLGRYAEARRLFALAKLRSDELQELGEYAAVIEKDGAPGEASRLLAHHFSHGRRDALFMRAWALLQIRHGGSSAAHEACAEFVRWHARELLGQYLLLEALERRWPGRPSPTTRLLAESILASFSELPPTLGLRFYAAGAANAVLGFHERAQYDFERATLIRGAERGGP